MYSQDMTSNKRQDKQNEKESISALVSKTMKTSEMMESLKSNGWVLIFDQDIATTSKLFNR